LVFNLGIVVSLLAPVTRHRTIAVPATGMR
jgi:hypothetical protein